VNAVHIGGAATAHTRSASPAFQGPPLQTRLS